MSEGSNGELEKSSRGGEVVFEGLRNRLEKASEEGKRRKYSRFILAALGSIPWVGGVLSATSAADSENEQGEKNEIYRLWLEEHSQKVLELGETIASVIDRVESFGDEVKDRLESEEYLAIVRKAFREWDRADTEEKREYIRRLLANSCATHICPDDLVRLFLDWIDRYHEAHFLVIKEIYKSPGITRGQIWDKIYHKRPREDSSEADLYKLLIRDLSTGEVIRQSRRKTPDGRYLSKQQASRKGSGGKVMKSAFDDSDPYELTQLGGQFVHYTMEEVVPRIGSEA